MIRTTKTYFNWINHGSAVTLLLYKHANFTPKICTDNHIQVLHKEESNYIWKCTERKLCKINDSQDAYNCPYHDRLLINNLYNCFTYIECEKSLMNNNLRYNTFFARDTTLNINQILLFLSKWVLYQPQLALRSECGIVSQLGRLSLLDWSFFCREVLVDYLIKTSQRIGGQNEIIRFTHCKFGTRKYASTNDSYNFPITSWVYTGIEENTGKYFFKVYPQRSLESIINVIYDFIEPETKILYEENCFLYEQSITNMKEFFIRHRLNPGKREFSNGLFYKAVQMVSSRLGHFNAGYLAFTVFHMSFTNQKKNHYHELLRILCETYKDKEPEPQNLTGDYRTDDFFGKWLEPV